MTARLVVLISGSGTNLQALLDACDDTAYGAVIVGVGSDRPGVKGLDRATARGIPTFVTAVSDYPDRSSWDAALTAECQLHRPDLVISAGFLRLVGPVFLESFSGRYINTHNALLPSFPGIHGPEDALRYGVKITGATVHFGDEGTDTGPVIAQVAVPVLDDDTPETLTERIKVAERRQLVETVGRLVREGWNVSGRKVTIGVGKLNNVDYRRPIRRAIISVYDKTGLEDLAKVLADAGVEIVSTGSTATRIEAMGIRVVRVDQLTDFPECLDGRVKTLHPRIHAGLLADTRLSEHTKQLADLGIEPFDLLVSHLYPFTQTVASGAGVDECVEQIDIGGPAMVRAAAKNYANVAVVTSPSEYPRLMQAVAAGGTTIDERKVLAARAFADIAEYDFAIAAWCARELALDHEDFPAFTGSALRRLDMARYGENPHQKAAIYADSGADPGVVHARQLQGKEMSYNNYVDTDAAWRAANDFDGPCVAIIKHANPCGIAVGRDIAEAYQKAHECDPASAYGGVIAANREITVEFATYLSSIYTEVLIAPALSEEARELLTAKKNMRILLAPAWHPSPVEWRRISGGALLQTTDRLNASGDDPRAWRLMSGESVDDQTLADLAFAWRAIRSVKSNAILLASQESAVGIGMGQVSRVDAARCAVWRAGQRAAGSVAASDAFFPFADGLAILIEAGVRAVVQPGGSIRDDESIALANQAGISMYFTGSRHFYH